jgi:hypothetical protein
MKNKEQLLNKENWVQYLNLADDGGLTNNAKANDIVSKIKEAINYSQCCKSDSEQLCYEDIESTKCLTCGDETCLDAECLQ